MAKRLVTRAVSGSLAVLAFGTLAASALAQGRSRAPENSDWPCHQILVRNISVPAVWTGPSIDDAKWQDDPKIVDLIDKVAARRMPLEEAEQAINDYAKTLTGDDKKTKLTALFAGLYNKLNHERGVVIEGLDRFGHKQKDLADKLRAETAELHAAQDAAGNAPLPDIKDQSEPGKAPGPEATILEKLQWDMRIFQDRHKSVSFVCESPVIIEQRLFALARAIQQNLDS